MNEDIIATIGNEGLVDVSKVRTDKELPRSVRVSEYKRKIKDIEHYACCGFKVTAVYPKTAPLLEERLQELAK